MKYMLLTSLTGLLLAGCANQSGPFTISKLYPIVNCSTTPPEDGDVQIITGNGYLDVAAGSPQYVLGVQIDGVVAQSELTVGDRTLEEQGNRLAYIREQEITYELSRTMGRTPEPYVQKLAFSFSGTLNFDVQLISPELGEILFDGLSAVDDLSDTVDIDVSITYRGEFADNGAQFTVGAIPFPIRALKSQPPVDCINGYFKLLRQVDDEGNPRACLYVGQTYHQNVPPAPPSECL